MWVLTNQRECVEKCVLKCMLLAFLLLFNVAESMTPGDPLKKMSSYYNRNFYFNDNIERLMIEKTF